jgi:hypothetical protein
LDVLQGGKWLQGRFTEVKIMSFFKIKREGVAAVSGRGSTGDIADIDMAGRIVAIVTVSGDAGRIIAAAETMKVESRLA